MNSGELNDKKIRDVEGRITSLGLENSSTRLIPERCVLIGLAGQGKTRGTVAINLVPLCVNQSIAAILPNESFVPEFLYYSLDNRYEEIRAMSTGASGRGALNLGIIRRIPVDMPQRIEEQSEIARVLSDVDGLIETFGELIAKKKSIKQGVMQELLTGRRRLSGFHNDWKPETLGQVFQILSSASKPWAELSEAGSIGYIHYGDVHTVVSPFLDCSKIELPRIERSKVSDIPLVKDGDLVMVNASEDYAGIGKSVEIRNVEGKEIVAGLHTFLLRGDPKHLANGFKGYLQFIPQVKEGLIMRSTGISVYGISKSGIKEVEVMLPDVDEQTAIAKVLFDMDAETEELVRERQKYVLIRQGMMQQLLTGRIRLR